MGMRLGLFGGSFDPVHWGHLILAECCREQSRLDRVCFVPAGIPPHKQDRLLTPGPSRIEMLELAIAGHEAFSVSRFEIDQGGVSYTVDTLRHFHQEDPSPELFLLLGADMLYDLPRWREAEEVCRLAIVVAARRPGVPDLDFGCLSGVTSPERIELFRRHQVQMPLIGLNSSDLRRRVAEGRSIRYQVPRAVEMYIKAHGLYGGGQRPVASGQ